ncbi:toll/interleukin-1 receptor domain-containing protein [Frankia gtarii]|uniref:toll/interleukin-1 receptor domain-containing protein n=1 Tax=Frankia gtarii TaxID=2950102 RepID=UPI0021BEE641|nr:toll/interleukin-1 receptor domain-containing protein [Frankia gtarii]
MSDRDRRGNTRLPDLRLSREERLDFLREVARVYRTEAAANIVLEAVGIPVERRPAWQNVNPEQWWGEVFQDFDAGIVASPYRTLMGVVVRTHPGNETLHRLAVRHGVIKSEDAANEGGRSLVVERPDDRGWDINRSPAHRIDEQRTPRPGRPARPDPATRVFLCHAHQDQEAVRELYHRLHRDGLQPWLDAEDLRPGQDWDLEIGRAIARCRSVVVCLSRVSTTKRGFVQTEIARALDAARRLPEGEIFVVPARLEACDLPDRLSRWHAVDLFIKGGYERLVDALRPEA